MDEVDRGAQRLVRGVVEDAGLAHVRAAVLAGHADDVVDVEHLGALAEVVALEVDAGVVAPERAADACGRGACAEEELADLDRGALVRGDAD